jgi:acetoacetate decarboxylase
LLPIPYRTDAEGTSTLVLDEPLEVGQRMTRSFIDGTGLGVEREWEVVAIEPTERDGEVAAIRAYSDKPPVLQGRLILGLPG